MAYAFVIEFEVREHLIPEQDALSPKQQYYLSIFVLLLSTSLNQKVVHPFLQN